MDFGIYTSFNGRIGRAKYWLASIILVVTFMALAFLAMVLLVGMFRGVFTFAVWRSADDIILNLVVFASQLLILYPWAALTVKRLHDRNRSGYLAAFLLVPSIITAVTDMLGLTSGSNILGPLDYVLSGFVLIVTVWFFIDLGCLRGTVGNNQYGPDPLVEKI